MPDHIARRTPWREWLRAAFAIGLTPAHFWRLSLREWRALIAPQTQDAFDRASFDALLARYPDQYHG